MVPLISSLQQQEEYPQQAKTARESHNDRRHLHFFGRLLILLLATKYGSSSPSDDRSIPTKRVGCTVVGAATKVTRMFVTRNPEGYPVSYRIYNRISVKPEFSHKFAGPYLVNRGPISHHEWRCEYCGKAQLYVSVPPSKRYPKYTNGEICLKFTRIFSLPL